MKKYEPLKKKKNLFVLLQMTKAHQNYKNQPLITQLRTKSAFKTFFINSDILAKANFKQLALQNL